MTAPKAENDRTSYTIVVASNAVSDAMLYRIACEAATAIAAKVDDGYATFDVDVVEGTFGDPMAGDNLFCFGRKVAEPFPESLLP